MREVVNTRRPLAEVLERWYPWCRDDAEELRGVYAAYVKRKEADRVLDYDDLLQILWRTANPVDDGGQYVDRGFQYTSAIWYQSEEERAQAEASKNTLQVSGRFGSGIIATPILPYVNFYRAEDYHQDYYKQNPLHYKVYTNGS